MPLVRAYLRGPVSASTAQGLSVGGLVRQPRVVVRDMLPAREPAPDISVAAVQVDGWDHRAGGRAGVIGSAGRCTQHAPATVPKA